MRAVGRAVAGILALGLVVGGALLVVEVVVALLERPPWLVPWDGWWATAQEQRWSAGDTRLLALVLVALGAALVAVGVGRWRPTELELRASDDGVAGAVRRAPLERALARRAEAIDGVGSAAVAVVGGRARVRVASTRRQPDGVDAEVAAALGDRLATLDLADPPSVEVAVRPRGA